MMLLATAVVASETLVVASFLENSLRKNLSCHFPELGTIIVPLLQSFDT